MALTAFVARSFDPIDVQRIRPILDFLDTFRKAGFLWDEAEMAEVERVSSKVTRMIDERDAFIGFFTRKCPVYSFKSRFKDAISLVLGNLQPTKWMPPAWVMQESGYALRANKSLILLREEGVDFPGLQGDIEYVPFDPANPSMVFPKLSEMINGLLAKEAGREIRTEVVENPEQAEAAPKEPTPPKQEEKLVAGEERFSDIFVTFVQMQNASDKRDLSGVRDAWKTGTALIEGGKGKMVDQLWWDCLYFESRYDAGDPMGIEELRRLHRENPKRHEPCVMIARLLSSAKEYQEAAALYLEAADSSTKEGSRALYLVNASKQLKELQLFEEALRIAENALSTAIGDRTEAVSLVYELLKDLGEPHLAFARAEAFLHTNPQLRVRFDLGLDYRRHGNKNLSLYHFKFLHDQNPEEAGALHNLSLLYADCGMPILSVRNYKKAIQLGETLSSANLGYMYLDAGMADEAKDIIKKATEIEPHESRVDACMAEISLRAQAQDEKEAELLKLAGDERNFYVNIGTALGTVVPPIDGLWKFPFGEIPLTRSDDALVGSAAIKKENLNSLASLLSGQLGMTQQAAKVETYDFKGMMNGAVCKFTLDITPQHEGGGLRSILGEPVSRSGFIVFAEDGKSGKYAELKDGNFESRVAIERAAVLTLKPA